MTAPPLSDQAVADALADGDRCVLAIRGDRAPVVTPTVFWSDGDAVWMTAAAGSAEVAALRARPGCALWIPAPGRRDGFEPGGRDEQDGRDAGVGQGPTPADRGAVVHGHARVFGAGDPVGLTLHGVSISAAMAALAVKQAGAVLGYARDAARALPRLALRRQVVVRVAIERSWMEARPSSAPGVAPALPAVVPADVRRALAGERRVVLALQGPEDLAVVPALWSSGFALEPSPARHGTGSAAVAVDTPPRRRPTEAVGLVLSGTVTARGTLDATTATWWRGFEVDSAPIPSVSGVTLPD